MMKNLAFKNILLGCFILLALFNLSLSQADSDLATVTAPNMDATGYSKESLNKFLDGILSGSMIGIDMDDFDEKDIHYASLSEKVETLITNYKSEDETDVQDFLRGFAEILDILDTQSELNELEGPTVDLLSKMSVPIMASGDFIFTYRTSLIIHEASVSEYYYRGEKIDFNNLAEFGKKLGNLAAKVYYDGKYDFDTLFPVADGEIRNLGESFTSKDYSMFKDKSVFQMRKEFLGMDNPNHKKDQILGKKLGVKVIEKSNTLRMLDGSASSYDFRTAHPKCVLPVRQQGSCGSCWAQSASGVIEKRVCKLTSSEVNNRLSPQRMVNCSTEDKGCQGGYLYGGWNHLQRDGISSETCTPYVGKDETCRATCANGSALSVIKTVPGTITLIRNDVQKIKDAIFNQGPVQDTFVKIYDDFMRYGSGIYKTNGSKFMGYHAMQIIGWGADYWIVENSWGNGWGEGGHVRIAFGEVGVSDYVIFATPKVSLPEVTCPDNCNICIKTGVCQPEGCAPGFRYVNGQCITCPANCKECTSASCPMDQCNDGFKGDSTGKCTPCENNCVKCSFTGCNQCSKGFTPNVDGKCVTCPTNCKVCQSEECPENQCNDGFFNNTTGSCSACAENCQKCSSKGCTQCKSGFIPNSNGVCVKCPANCKSCTSSQCPKEECNKGFKNINGVCTACQANCTDCNEKGCKEGACSLGFKNDGNGKCVACSENCINCSTKGCTTCKTGFELKDNKCEHVKCPEGCAKCTGGVCESCIDGHSLQKDKKCVKCAANCSKCDENAKCLECNKPLHLVNQACQECPEKCSNCKEGKCEQCASGLVRNGKGECVKCDENCRYCGPTGCMRCNYGFWNNNRSCTKCADNCRSCRGEKCYRCDYKFWKSNGTCTKCTENCRYCGPRGCYLCEKGFSKKNGVCVKCPENCNRCNSRGCSYWGCALGFGWNKGQCKKCDDNCSVCSRYGCRRCSTGFFLDRNRQCQKCKSPCLACNSRRCLKCPPGYKNGRNGCYKCPENCRSCNHRGCYSFGCDKGFGITKDYQCAKCTENCNKCNGDGCYSRSCDKGYGNDMGRPRKCEKCTENCSHCYRGKCRRCSYGFSMTSDRKSCVNCGKNCAICNADGNCRRCTWRFYPKNGQCTACPPNCLWCRNGKCLWCSRGFRRNRSAGTCYKR